MKKLLRYMIVALFSIGIVGCTNDQSHADIPSRMKVVSVDELGDYYVAKVLKDSVSEQEFLVVIDTGGHALTVTKIR